MQIRRRALSDLHLHLKQSIVGAATNTSPNADDDDCKSQHYWGGPNKQFLEGAQALRPITQPKPTSTVIGVPLCNAVYLGLFMNIPSESNGTYWCRNKVTPPQITHQVANPEVGNSEIHSKNPGDLNCDNDCGRGSEF